MSSNESHEPEAQTGSNSISDDAEEWGSTFSKFLRIEFSAAVSKLPTGATTADYRRAMIVAVANVLSDSGADSDEIKILLHDPAVQPSSADESVEWTGEKNIRRRELIDKSIQKIMSRDEAAELERLTDCMRAHYDTEEMVPIEGARRLHRQLLEPKESERPRI